MKLPKRVYLAVAVLLFMGGAGTAVALYPDSEPKKVVIEQASSVSEPVVEAAATNSAPAETGQTATTPDVEPTPAPEQPKYGEDSDNAGVYLVFDKAWVMDQAGIAVTDRQYVDKILKGWVYKADNPAANLCGAYPATKMQSFGEDYLDNPVTQLKWCTDYVSKRYDTWQKASDYFDANKAI